MRIQSIEINDTSKEANGISLCNISEFLTNLPNTIMLTGGNGSGKSRLLRLISSEFKGYGKLIFDLEGTQPKIIDFSCDETPLQSIDKFPAWTINNAKDNLPNMNITETALNSLLYIQSLAKGNSSDEFQDFANFANDLFDIKIAEFKLLLNKNELLFYNRKINGDELSPGQKYLLRMAVALYLNSEKENIVLLIDEPETHLHPAMLIRFFDKLRDKFSHTQMWIATHSLALIAHLYNKGSECSIFYMQKGCLETLRSDSEPLVNGLVGGIDNWTNFQHILSLPNEFAGIRFAAECLRKPFVLAGSNSEKPDKQAELINNDIKDKIILDYGVGKGRLLYEVEKICIENKTHISKEIKQYYAYNINDNDKDECVRVMQETEIREDNYCSGDIKSLLEKVNSKADCVLLVNVLHEIPPCEWTTIFANIKSLLCDNGKLIIVEQKELTVGEKAYDEGFMVLTEKSAKKLFKTEIECKTDEKDKIIAFYIPNNIIGNADFKSVSACLKQIQEDSLENIENNHKKENTKDELKGMFKLGLKMAFWTHQYTNAARSIAKIQGGCHNV
jgi:ABC-type branched-subunit amino acid transport system ATPase component